VAVCSRIRNFLGRLVHEEDQTQAHTVQREEGESELLMITAASQDKEKAVRGSNGGLPAVPPGLLVVSLL